MINRNALTIVENALSKYPVVGLLGPRQVGKTTLAKKIRQIKNKNVIYLDLELPSDVNKLRSPELYLKQYEDNLVIVDEVQRMPSLFPLLRALVDQKRTAGRFLVLGSASLELIKNASESLAGRVHYQELTPFSLTEIGTEKYEQLWLKGGYPLSFLSADENSSFEWRANFVKTYLEMDIPQLGISIPSLQLRRFWGMLVHYNGQLWNASQIAQGLGISAPTVRSYLDILEETFIVRSLTPMYSNVKKRLIKSPKVYVRDSGLLHYLLGVKNLDDLQGHPGVGPSWEGFVIEQIASMMPSDWQLFFYRSSAGAEIDLVLLDDRKRNIAVEIKYSATPKPLKGFWNAYKDLECVKGFIVYPGKESYPLSESVKVLPINDFEAIFA